MTQEGTPINIPAGHYYYGTGRRKTAIARVRLYPGSGAVEINGRAGNEVFSRVIHLNKVKMPLEVVNMAGTFDVKAKVTGGGVSAWSDALAHGIARALLSFDEGLRPSLRKAGLLTRDSRVKERKKYGLKRARKAPQYTKR